MVDLDLPRAHRWPLTLRFGPLALRPIERRDAAELRQLRARNREWTGPWDTTVPPQGVPRSLTFGRMVAEQRARGRAATQLSWLLTLDPGAAGGGEARRRRRAPIVGQLTVADIVYGAGRFASIGYWIDEGHAGRGLVPLAAAIATDYCFEVLELHRLEICIRPENQRSLRVVDKLGYRREGLRPRYLHIDGDWRDHLVFVMTSEDCPAGGLVRALVEQRVQDAATNPAKAAGDAVD